MVYIPNNQHTNKYETPHQHINMSTTPRRRMIALMMFLCNISLGVAFTDSHVTRVQQTRHRLSQSPRFHTIPTKALASTMVASVTPSTAKTQLSMIPRKVLLHVLEYIATPPSNKEGSTNILSNASTTAMSKVLPLALLTKAFTTPTAAFGLTGTTMVTTAAAGSIFSHSSDVVTVETQVLNDMSHLGIDLASFFIPSLLLLRIAAIIGRICTITADYIPDHVIVPEELAFQIAMLCLACSGLIKSALIPAAALVYNATSVKDGRAYGSIFQPAGTSWSQYKALSVCGALEWITLQAGDTLNVSSTRKDESSHNEDDEDYMYWLYSGDVVVKTDSDELVYAISSGKKASASLHRGFFGEQRLLQRLGKIPKPQPARSSSKNQRDATSKPIAIGNRVAVTSSTATMLRISTRRLQMLMELDPTLAESMRTLVFQGMEAKLHAHVQETTNLLKSYNVTSTVGNAAV